MSEIDNTYQEQVERAELSLVNEDWELALNQYDQILATVTGIPASELAEIYNGRGAALLKLERVPEAIAALQKALEYEPDLPGVRYNLAMCYQAAEDYPAALAEFDRAIEQEPNDAEFYFRRGGIYFQLEQYEKTVEDNSRAIELHPAGAITGPYIARGLAYYQLERFDEALQDFSQAIDGDPRAAAEAYFYRALVFLQQGDAMSARADLQAYLLMTDDPDGMLATQAREIIEELDAAE